MNTSFLIIILFFVLFTGINFDMAEAYKTGSYNFCSAFPLFPECVGWRTNPISDSFNYWFCDYVDLAKLCENKPDPKKQITIRDEDFCCKFIGPELKTSTKNDSTPKQILGADSPSTSVKPLIIWTDKDHYNFRDKVIVYGKFDFTSFNIKKNVSELEFDQTARLVNGTSIQTGRIIQETPVLDVDIKLNGRKVLKDIPVHENGWFVAFFHLNDRYNFANQNNLLEVEYITYEYPIPLGGPKTHSTYHFTSGDISKKEEKFGIWLDDSFLPHKIRFGVNVENPEKFIELSRHNLVITRLTTPQGYVIPVAQNFLVKDLSAELSGFSKYGHGTYEIQVTYGNNIAKATFEY